MNFLKLPTWGKAIALLVLGLNGQFWGKPPNVTAQTSEFLNPTVLGSKQPIALQDTAENICPAELPSAIDALIDRPEFSQIGRAHV